MDARCTSSRRASLCKIFTRGDREIEALSDVTIGIAAGEFVSIVGASGCGKTTFLGRSTA